MENISVSVNFIQQAQEWLSLANLSLPVSLAESGLVQQLLSLQPSDQGSPRQGCGNDPFAIFGFLAFILVVLQLLANNGNRRRRREAEQKQGGTCHAEPQDGGGQLAATLIFQGFLKGFDGDILEILDVSSILSFERRLAAWMQREVFL